MLNRLVTVLQERERLSWLSEIMSLLMLRFFKGINYQHALVATALPVTMQQQTEIVEGFKKLTGTDRIDAQFIVDPRLIAGMRIVSQDYLWEASLAQKIKVNRYGY